jgi:hypothetical protein
MSRTPPRLLVACERFGRVRDSFRRLGIDAVSCDIEASEAPGPHIRGDVLEVLDDGWDAMIAFPPCTHLASSGARWFPAKRADGRQAKAIAFFMALANCRIPKKGLENPIGIMSTEYRKPDQIIQPWQYGHGETKATCLWLQGLPVLTPTKIVSGRHPAVWLAAPSPERAAIRGKTYQGIADAMAAQWAPVLTGERSEP